MGFGDVDRERRNSKGDLKPRNIRRVIEMDEPVFFAIQETVNRLQGTSPMTIDQFIQQAVQRDLRRRNVTWWESRISKAMRVMSGSQG